MIAAYLMNRDKPLIVEPLYSQLSRLREPTGPKGARR